MSDENGHHDGKGKAQTPPSPHSTPAPSIATGFRRQIAPLRWEGVEVLAYKKEGSAPFRDVTRQVLFDDPAMGCQLRYFEVAPGGYTTLERHEHHHAVVVQHGRGRCFLGDHIQSVAPFDLIEVPSLTWHQFRADEDAPLGFLCMVNMVRDKPQLPDAEALALLRANPAMAAFIRT